MGTSYSNEIVKGTLDVLGKSYASANSILALGAVVGDASTLTGQSTPSGSPMTGIGDKLDLYGGQYGFGVQAGRVVCYMGGGGFAVRLGAASGQRSSGTDAVTLFTDGTVTATGPVNTPTVNGTTINSTTVNGSVINQTGVLQTLSVSGFNPNAVLPNGLGGFLAHDALRWKVPTLIETSTSASAPSWTTSGAPSAATVQSALSGLVTLSTLQLTVANPALRIAGSGMLATYISHLLVGCRYAPGTLARIIYETSPDNTTWTTRGDTVSSVDVQSKWTVIPVNDIGNGDYWRITFLATTIASSTPIGAIEAISTRPGDQGVSEATDLPYYWDASRNMYLQQKLFAPNRMRAGFNANTNTAPLTTSALEAELSVNSMITLGESAAGSADPAITMYRTQAGARAGQGFRQRFTVGANRIIWEWGTAGATAWGAETYTQALGLDAASNFTVTGNLSVRSGIAAQMSLVGSVASGPPTSGTFAVGDISLSRADGRIYVCTVAGTPGTWGDTGARSTVTALARSTAAISLTEPWTSGSSIDTYTLDKPGIWVRAPGAQGYMAVAGDASARRRYSAPSITGDLDVRVKLAPSSWASGSNQNLAGKYGEANGRRGWLFGLTATGTLVFSWSPTGAATFAQKASTAAVGFAAGQPGWVRAVMDVDNGASGYTITFYTSNDGVSWTTLGSQTGAGVTSIYDNVATQPDYTVGSLDTGGGAGDGDIYHVEIRNGISGTLVTPVDPTLWTSSVGTVVLYPVIAPVAGTNLKVALKQDTIGGRTVTWSSNIAWIDGIPVLSSAANAVDYFQFDCFDGVNWVGRSLTAAPRDTVAAAPKTNTAINLPNPASTAQIATATVDRAAYPIRLPGSSPGYLTNVTGGATYAAPSITGDIDVVVKVSPAAWTGVLRTLVSKYETPSNLRGWRFDVSATGALQFAWTTDGAAGTFFQQTSNVIVPFTGTQVGWVRAVLDVNNGASGHSCFFYTSTDGVAWTQLGTTLINAVTSIFNNPTIPYQVGSFGPALAQPFPGDILYVEIRNGIAGTNIVPTDPSTWSVLAGATAYPVSAPAAGTSLAVVLTQDATGSRTVTWPSNVKWPGGTAPVLSTAANAVDYLQLDCVDGANWLGRSLGLAYA